MPNDQHQTAEEDWSKVEENFRRVYFYIGKCVTRYQAIEDHLYDTFLSVMDGSNMRAATLFEVANSLESKLKLVTAATVDRDNSISDLWRNLRPRIKAAAELRNQIAHGTPVQVGRGAIIKVDEKAGSAELVGYIHEHSHLRVQKSTRSGLVEWTLDDLQAIHSRFVGVWINQLTFNTISQGNAIPKNFKDAWDHPTVQSWQTR